MRKDTQEVRNNKDIEENIFPEIKFDKQNVIFAGSDQYNRFGLDLTNPDIIKFEEGNIEFEIIGGVNDVTLNQMKVSLKIQKKLNTSSTDVYRTQSVDLFNEGQVKYLITSASEKTKVPSITMTEVVYSLIQKLEEYKRDKIYSSPKELAPVTSSKVIKDVKDFLKEPNLLDNIKVLLERTGIPDSTLALKLFILSSSRLTDKPMHTILQGSVLLSNEFCKLFSQIIPDEDLKQATSISKNALSYSPYPNYWSNKLLVIHQLEGTLSQKDSTLQEYMTNDGLNRYVTEVNHINGKYLTGQKTVSESFCVMGYTSKDFHKVFTSPSVVCLPMCNTSQIKARLNDLEIKKYAGLLNENEIHSSIQTLQHIQRLTEPIRIINPYLDQIEFQSFFDNDVKKIRQFMQLTNLVTMLHKFQLNPKKKDGILYYEVQPQFMLDVLELYKELWVTDYDELYFQVMCTLSKIKSALKKEHSDGYKDEMFTEKEIQQLLKTSPSTLNKHFKKLTLHNMLERVYGNNKTGYYYKVSNWNDSDEKDKLQNFKIQIQNLRNS